MRNQLGDLIGLAKSWLTRAVMICRAVRRFRSTATLTRAGWLAIALVASTAASTAESQATRLRDGRVLVPQGSVSELYDPSSGQWSLTSAMYFGQPNTDAVLLPNGEVLIYGSPNSTTYSGEFYNPSTNVWARTFGQNYGNILFGPLTLLNTGKALLAGGAGKYRSILRSAMLYDPSTNYWTLTGSLNQSRRTHTLTLLPDGQALAAGGVSKNSSGDNIVLGSVELYTP